MACQQSRDLLGGEVQTLFDADELAAFFERFSPLEDALGTLARLGDAAGEG